METKLNIDLKTILFIVVGFIILFGGGFGWLGNKLNKTTYQLEEQKNLTLALQDDIHYTTNKLNEETASKKTLQAGLDALSRQNLNLSQNQEELLERIDDVQKENTLISAALVKTEAKLDSALFADAEVDVNENDSSITFIEKNDSINFDIRINKAIPALKFIQPTITINSLTIPNKQFVQFHWENDKDYKQKPVSFSITNSNPLITTTDIDSYMIPEVNKNALKPTGMQKVGTFFKDRKTEVIVGLIATSIGIYVGATTF